MYKKYQDIGKLHPLICKNKALNIMKISILLLLFFIWNIFCLSYRIFTGSPSLHYSK